MNGRDHRYVEGEDEQYEFDTFYGEEADRYGSGSWAMYDEYILQRVMGTAPREDGRAYIPSPLAIQQRIMIMRWLEECGFSKRIITAIMVEDCPPISMVFDLVSKVGAEEAHRRLKVFLRD